MDVVIENRIREFRKEMGLSQNALAKMVGLKRRSIMAYESNTISPTLETAYKSMRCRELSTLYPAKAIRLTIN